MLLGQVEGFLEVVRHGNVSRAATALSITQPALTARLQGLEREVGQKLFVRARKGIQLTEAGRAFLPYAERAVASLRGGMELVSEMRSGGTGELVLAAAPAVSTYVLPTLLVRFAAQHPSVRLVVRTGHSEEVVEMVARGEVQLGIVRALRHPMVTTRPLYEDEVILVTDPRHPFAATGRVTLDQLTEARLILFDRASSYYDLTNAIFREAGVLPRAVMELDNIEAAKKMVELGLGVAVLPQTAIADELRQGVLRAVEIEGSPRIRRRIVM
ncbi:MAG: LysR family transcriptional regulator, partial [Chloroflexi bacterium]|nr:LysR family transcriptional regulator [Chloroflexota bacterium]